MCPAVPITGQEDSTGGSPMAYIAISLSLALAVWLFLAAKAGSSARVDTLTGDLVTDLRRSPHRESGPARRGDQLADHGSTRHLARHQQPARGLRVGQQDQLQLAEPARQVRSHPVEVAA